MIRTTKPPVTLKDYDCTWEETLDEESDFAEEDFTGFLRLLSEDGSSELQDFQATMIDTNSDKWMEVAGDEYHSLMKNMTWVLIARPVQKTIGCKWIVTRKPGIAGVENPRFKARLVAKGL
ncbi:unnamed protein product [Microthlaspi erraticum]|uniref:Reverse transcriptase Ty1/copia-type domain-containing protein n=1 Tax=Microthlaspi erraticum TaxID=1685480 RepID=A0A6D2KW22_9BRAS|nr:unnamed protein product [Microthlaspi erraticum]